MNKLKSLGSVAESRQTRRTMGSESTRNSILTGQSSYTVKSLKTSNYQTDYVSETRSPNQGSIYTQLGNQEENNETIKLMPVKIKDLMQILENNPSYRDKSPVMLNMKENDIDEVVRLQQNGKLAGSQRISPISVVQSGDGNSPLRTQVVSRSYANQLFAERESGQMSSKPPLGEQQAPQVYAMTDIQAYPMVGETRFKPNATKTQRKKSRVKRPKSRVGVSTSRRSRNRKRSKSPRQPSGVRARPRSRGRSRPRRSRPRSSRPRRSRPRRIKVVPRRRKSPPVMVVRRSRRPSYPSGCCSPYPLCDNDCSPDNICPPGMIPSRMSVAGNYKCTMFQDKLQFIQPSVCSKKTNFWTNEYAIIPKNQVHLIDPCTELDPTLYPRADNPCIRDGRGNPLTDCIGRPLRDPVGERFLNFSANGSVMDTNFRGNFYSGQPPVCVKCTFPRNTCVPDTTHNWWMSCGYPIRPNMNPYFQRVVAAENRQRR